MTVEQDYIDLFSMMRKGHMSKYVYMYRPDIYEHILKQEAYYPFRMESDLLIQMSNEISKNLENVSYVFELGPGSRTPILSKTVPLLRTLKSQVGLFTYTAVDSSLEYAKQACELIGANFKDIKTYPLEIDFLLSNAFDNIDRATSTNDNKLMMCFGQSIFANNNDSDIEVLLKNIGRFLNKNDYFLFGVDKNQNEVLLENAYNTKPMRELLLNSMYYLKYALNLEDFNPEAFDLIYKWDGKENIVELSLKSLANQIIKIREQELAIEKGQEFNIVNSKKPSIEIIKKFLLKENFVIKKIVSSDINKDSKISIVIAQKQSTI